MKTIVHILTLSFLVLTVGYGGLAQVTPTGKFNVYKSFSDTWAQRDALALKRLAPGLAASEKANQAFLKRGKSGILFLATKQPCSLKAKNKVLNDDDLNEIAKTCPARNFQGEAQHFSFRRKAYVESEQADLSYTGELIYSNGMFAHGLIVKLGEMPVETLSVDSKGMSALRNMNPATTAIEADEMRLMIEKGFQAEGFSYSKGVVPTVNTTYSLRVIAYRVPWEKSNTYLGGYAYYSPLFKDERADVMVVFRIVAIEPNGITILWRELQRKSSPLLEK